MLRPIPIDDPADERVADFVGLTDAVLRRRHGTFVLEGELVLRRAIEVGLPLRGVLVTPPRLRALADELGGLDAPVHVAEQSVMNAIAGFDIHRGVLASAPRPTLRSVHEVVEGAERVVVAEGLTDHENVGGLFRNAAAFGVDAVLLDPRSADPLYRRAVRVSVGHVLSMPWTRAEPWPTALGDLRALDFEVVALTPAEGAEPLAAVEVAAGDRVAVLVGSEGAGLSEEALALATRRVRIPMAGHVDSVNVATAAALACYQFWGRSLP